jgi:hypothetical protein
MDVERTVRNCTDDDSTMHSIQDRPSVQVHNLSSNLNNKKKKYMNPSMILTLMKIMRVIIKPIKRECGSLRTNERLILLP